jgi:intergrase/recombinase
MKPRRDYDTARLIDASIAALRAQGMYVAARMLCESGVPLETAQRVLRQPSQRRTYGDAILH